MRRNEDSGNVCPQALQEEDYTSTHQSSIPPTSGVEYCSLPHLPYWQGLRSVTNTTTIIIIRSPPLDDGVISRESRVPSMLLSIERGWCSDPVVDAPRNRTSSRRHCLFGYDVTRRREGLVERELYLETDGRGVVLSLLLTSADILNLAFH